MQAINRNLLSPIRRGAAGLLVAALAFGVPGGNARADMAKAMDAVRADDWDKAARAAGRRRSVARDIVEWHRLRDGEGSSKEVTAFLERRADWPGLPLLRRKSEAGFAAAGTRRVLKFFASEEPRTASGAFAHARALRRAGLTGEAEAALVLAWRTMPMNTETQSAFLKDHARLLARHHAARLDRLLWDGHRVSARRMLPLVSRAQRALAEARMALQEQKPGVDAAISRVPEELRDAPGLAYDRFVWRVRKGRKADAISLLTKHSASPEMLGLPDKWAKRRLRYARDAMQSGKGRTAYAIAAPHHLTEGSDFAALEWMAGYVALRQLNDPATALRHFRRFDNAVLSPISKGRAGYWIGRALEAAGDMQGAYAAYDEAAKHQTSFYGLLAAERAGLPFDPSLANPGKPPSWQKAAFTKSSVFEAGMTLLRAGEPVLAERFLTHLTESLSPGQAAQLGEMAIELGDSHLAVMIAKRAAQAGVVLPRAYFPLHPVAREKLPMAPEMVLAIARRESEFDPVVVSGAGARGLMQVMPATGRLVARSLGVESRHSTGRMLSDWKYNARLGANYLAGLAGDFDGNVVMMAAGYNAGPKRPTRWMEQNGDPRGRDMDAIVDWIERIPFSETRNYVMRVTESLPVYRARLGKEPLPIPFSRELTGSTLRAFAP